MDFRVGPGGSQGQCLENQWRGGSDVEGGNTAIDSVRHSQPASHNRQEQADNPESKLAVAGWQSPASRLVVLLEPKDLHRRAGSGSANEYLRFLG